MKRAIRLLGVFALACTVLAACGGRSAQNPTPSATPTPRPAGTTTPAPGSTASPGAPTPAPAGYSTAQEAADAGARDSGQELCATQFPGTPFLTGAQVSVYRYVVGPCGPGGHAVMAVYVYLDAGRWNPYTWGATQSAGLPTGMWGEHSSMPSGGCVNVRESPSLSGRVVTCLAGSTVVFTAGQNHSPWHEPVWADGRIWWYVFRPTSTPGIPPATGTPLGWVVLDYLVCNVSRDPRLSC